MGIKIEAGSEDAVSALSLDGARRLGYSLSWLCLVDTFLGVEDGALWEPAGFFGNPPDTDGSASPLLLLFCLPSPRSHTGRNGSNVGRQRVGRSCLEWRAGAS